MRIVNINGAEGQAIQHFLIPETHIENFLLWVMSFKSGTWVNNLAGPFYRSLVIVDNSKVCNDDGVEVHT